MVFQKRLVNPFDIDVNALKCAVQEQSGKVAPRCRYLEIAQYFCDQGFAEQTAELHTIVQGNSFESEKMFAFGKRIEFDQKTAFMLLVRL